MPAVQKILKWFGKFCEYWMHYWKGIRYVNRQNLIFQRITEPEAKSLLKCVLAHRLLKGVPEIRFPYFQNNLFGYGRWHCNIHKYVYQEQTSSSSIQYLGNADIQETSGDGIMALVGLLYLTATRKRHHKNFWELWNLDGTKI